MLGQLTCITNSKWSYYHHKYKDQCKRERIGRNSTSEWEMSPCWRWGKSRNYYLLNDNKMFNWMNSTLHRKEFGYFSLINVWTRSAYECSNSCSTNRFQPCDFGNFGDRCYLVIHFWGVHLMCFEFWKVFSQSTCIRISWDRADRELKSRIRILPGRGW